MALNLIILGKQIKQFRKRRGMTQADLAGQINRATTYISYIESGQRCMSLETFVEIANALYVSADELLKDNLDNTLMVSNHDFAELLTDCTVLERKAMLLAASTAKKFVRENRGAMRSGRY